MRWFAIAANVAAVIAAKFLANVEQTAPLDSVRAAPIPNEKR